MGLYVGMRKQRLRHRQAKIVPYIHTYIHVDLINGLTAGVLCKRATQVRGRDRLKRLNKLGVAGGGRKYSINFESAPRSSLV